MTDRQVDILRQARLTPSLDGDAADETEPPLSRCAELLDLARRGDVNRVHAVDRFVWRMLC